MTRLAQVVINGRYELHRSIGRGGMAEVYLARDQMLDRAVAVKVLLPALAIDPGFVERFHSEAQSAAGLNHPNIVGVHDLGEANGTVFVVTEYVEGETLAELIAREGRLHPDRAAEIAAGIAAALGFAHRNGGVVHRDVKPANVLITRDGDVKVADFAIAGAFDTAPAADPRNDVHGLGGVLHEMLIGRPPSPDGAPVGPRRIDPTIPETLDAIVLKSLATRPANRYPSAQDMRADLRRYREGARIGAQATPTPTPAPALPVDLDVTAVMTTIDLTAATDVMERPKALPTRPVADARRGRDDPDDGSSPRSYAVIAVLGVVLLVLAGFLVLLNSGRSSGGDLSTPTTGDATVPRVVGMQQADAEAALAQADLVPAVETAASDTVPAGAVVDQNPAANESIASGSAVTITVSSGAANIAVPDLTNQTQDAAVQAITDLGLVPSPKQVESQTVAEGTVIATNPPAGTEVARGATIEIQVSARPTATGIPDVTGQPEDQARAELEGAGFQVTVTDQPSRRRFDGQVISQNPAPGTPLAPGSPVEIVVGRRGGDFDWDWDGDGDGPGGGGPGRDND